MRPASGIRTSSNKAPITVSISEASVEFIGLPPIVLLIHDRLFVPPHEYIFEHQQVDFGPHQATVRVLRGTYDRFAAHVERRVHEHPAPCQRLERTNQRMEIR